MISTAAKTRVLFMSSASINGASCKPGLVYIFNVSEQNISFFVLVDKLILCTETVVLVCFYLKSICYACNLHVYDVEATDKLSFFKPGHELNPHPLNMYVVGAKNCICMRYDVYSKEVQSRDVEVEAGNGGSDDFLMEAQARKVCHFRFHICLS